MFERPPRLHVCLPDDLRERRLRATELLEIAPRAELERRDALDETSRCLEELTADVIRDRVARAGSGAQQVRPA